MLALAGLALVLVVAALSINKLLPRRAPTWLLIVVALALAPVILYVVTRPYSA
ncbi:hypothetical protein [Actinopolymorpha singaporensis]|uniref:Uncharacterized protein n=1 Tax=Actinopolymorpha singaporensis TaxID=117157 RepID=A0A1H1Q7M8_9ACTN|nr:hypothetical protein [Actinopolymorpha singaporensis]SDS19400.1 hypothetical protein SAMN04489717_1913 [Actinopolymorpha singaporensis]